LSGPIGAVLRGCPALCHLPEALFFTDFGSQSARVYGSFEIFDRPLVGDVHPVQHPVQEWRNEHACGREEHGPAIKR
jgi:hypothetical protein